MTRTALVALDIAAILVLTMGLYFPRHRRKDMLVAYLGVNIGVMAVSIALTSATVGAGLGLGLFGVLSIIRLRSAELDHEEIAYYFAALAFGLLAGFDIDPSWLAPALMAAMIVALYVGDHPRLFGSYRTQMINLDAAFLDESALRGRLEELLNANVRQAKVRRVDLVNQTTLVEVRYSHQRKT